MSSRPKWFDVGIGVLGSIDGVYIPFPTEDEYIEYLKDIERRQNNEEGVQQEGNEEHGGES